VPPARGTSRPDPATARLAGWIGPVVDAAGYDLEELVVTPAGRRSVVRVVVDRDQGVTLDDIAEVSKAVSDVLDTQDDGMGRTPYVLEVTSPGVDRTPGTGGATSAGWSPSRSVTRVRRRRSPRGSPPSRPTA
jgi:ribosome maturation factor RimP